MKTPRFSWMAGLVMAVVFLRFFVNPSAVCAHGELPLRIAAVTRQIAVATNHWASLYLQRGELYREHQDWAAAKSDYDRAAQLDAHLGVDFYRARMLFEAGETTAARAIFDQVLADFPAHGEALVGRARVLLGLRERTAAIADFQRGLTLLTKPEPEYFLELAQALADEGKADDALHCLDDGIKKLGSLVALQSGALDLELAQKNTNAALARLEVMIAEAPRPENWLARHGEILAAAGRTGEARKSYQLSLAAMDQLPRLLRQGPPMQKLQAQVHAALVNLGEN